MNEGTAFITMQKAQKETAAKWIVQQSHYLPFIKMYKDADMSDKPYILLQNRIDVLHTESLKRLNAQ